MNLARNSWARSSLRWPLAKLHQLQAAGGDEAVDVGDERLGHRVHQRRGGVVVAAVADEEALHPAAVGQPGLPHVEIHPVDRLHLEDHVIVEDIGDAARYGHRGLRSTGGQQAHQPLRAVHTPDRHAGHGLDPADRSPRRRRDQPMHAFGHGAKPG